MHWCILWGTGFIFSVYTRNDTQLENTNQEKQFIMLFAKCHLTMTLHRKDQILLNAHYLNSSTRGEGLGGGIGNVRNKKGERDNMRIIKHLSALLSCLMQKSLFY